MPGQWRLCLALLLSLCWACSSNQADDLDGDGSPKSEDCNDRQPRVHPGAEEVCDGLDNDCNGIVDDAESADAACDDGNFCTVGERCESGACTAGARRICDEDDNPCTQARCDDAAQECALDPAPLGTTCDDGVNCTDGDRCVGRMCEGTPVVCVQPADTCRRAVCNEDDGECEPIAEADGTACDDNNLCTSGDSCLEGSCEPGTPRDCSAGTVGCDEGVCDRLTGECTTQPIVNGGACDDGDPCTVRERCIDGTCGGGQANSCVSVADACNVGSCDAELGGCFPVPVEDGTACDDTDPCTPLDRCDAGNCLGTGPRPACDDGDLCTADSCESGVGCRHSPTAPDADEDLFGTDVCELGDDCNDENPDIHPGAAELCNGIDDDCDGGADPDVAYARAGEQPPEPIVDRRLGEFTAPAAVGNGDVFGIAYADTNGAERNEVWLLRAGADGQVANPMPQAITGDFPAAGRVRGAGRAGELAFVWPTEVGDDLQIAIARVGNGGTVLGDGASLISSGLGQRSAPSIVANDINYAVVYRALGLEALSPGLYFQRVGREGNPDGEATPVAFGSDANASTLTWNGEAYGLAFVRTRPGANQIVFQRIDEFGIRRGEPVIVSESAGTSGAAPGLGFDGVAWGVTWEERSGEMGDGPVQVRYQRIDAEGQRVGESAVVVAPEGDARGPVFAAGQAGGAVAWYDNRPGETPFGVWWTRIDRDGQVIQTPQRTADTTNTGGAQPSIAWLGSPERPDLFLVAWLDFRNSAGAFAELRFNVFGCP